MDRDYTESIAIKRAIHEDFYASMELESCLNQGAKTRNPP